MDEIRLPQHVVDRINRRFRSRFAQVLEDRRRVRASSADTIPDRMRDASSRNS